MSYLADEANRARVGGDMCIEAVASGARIACQKKDRDSVGYPKILLSRRSVNPLSEAEKSLAHIKGCTGAVRRPSNWVLLPAGCS